MRQVLVLGIDIGIRTTEIGVSGDAIYYQERRSIKCDVDIRIDQNRWSITTV